MSSRRRPAPQPELEATPVVSEAIALLPERQRLALFLREWQQLSYGEIAAVLETSEAAVETLLFRARESARGSARRTEAAQARARPRRSARLAQVAVRRRPSEARCGRDCCRRGGRGGRRDARGEAHAAGASAFPCVGARADAGSDCWYASSRDAENTGAPPRGGLAAARWDAAAVTVDYGRRLARFSVRGDARASAAGACAAGRAAAGARGTARHARRGRPCGRQQSAGADGDIAPHHRRRHPSGGGRLDGGNRGTGGDRCDVLDRRRNRQDGRCGGAGDGRRGSACRSSHGRRRRANRHRRDAGGLEHGLAPAREAVITRREFRAAAASRALRLEWGHEHTGATWFRRGRIIRHELQAEVAGWPR